MTERAFPIISVRDLAASRDFYSALGFVQTYQFPPDGEPGFVTMERGGSSIGIGAGGAVDEDQIALWVYVDDVDATLDRLRAGGAAVVAEPEDQPWGERVARVEGPATETSSTSAPRSTVIRSGGHGGDRDRFSPTCAR